MTTQENNLNWFEIPASDILRAKAFYEAIFDIEMYRQEMMGQEMAFFPAVPGNGKANGALVQSPDHIPSKEGSKIYLNGNPDMNPVLERIESAGGKIMMPKTDIGGDNGYMAFFIDTEGNLVGLHSMQ